MENRHFRINRTDRFKGAAIVVHQNFVRKRGAVRGFLRVVSLLVHSLHAGGTTAGCLIDDVKENAVRIREHPHGFRDVVAEVIEVRRVEAERPETGLEGARFPADIAAVFVDFTPFRVIFGRVAVDSGGQVNRNVDADFLAGVKLGAQEVELEIRVHHADFGRVVAHAVVAERKAGDGIDMCGFQAFLPNLFIELLPDPGNHRRGVKVQMNLSETKFVHDCLSFISISCLRCNIAIKEELATVLSGKNMKNFHKFHEKKHFCGEIRFFLSRKGCKMPEDVVCYLK